MAEFLEVEFLEQTSTTPPAHPPYQKVPALVNLDKVSIIKAAPTTDNIPGCKSYVHVIEGTQRNVQPITDSVNDLADILPIVYRRKVKDSELVRG